MKEKRNSFVLNAISLAEIVGKYGKVVFPDLAVFKKTIFALFFK